MILSVLLSVVTGWSISVLPEQAQAQQATSSVPAQVRIDAYARIQSNHRSQSANDIYDEQVYSPKSALFSADGTRLYMNSLEGGQTLVYAWPSLKKLKSINHTFNSKNDSLFEGQSGFFDLPFYTKSRDGNPNHFMGKPVEMALSHEGRYLWITYYRRSYDAFAQSPSAVAIVDTMTNQIVRVMPTGPIPKFIAISPDNKTAAIVHWGNNTVGFIDISSNDPRDFKYTGVTVVENQKNQEGLENTNRDSTCGFCLRGAVFDPTSEYLFVARMGGGGLAGIHVPDHRYLGTLLDFPSTPRHLVLTNDQQNLIVSSNVSGYLSKVPVVSLIHGFDRAFGRRINGPHPQSVFVGKGARTVEIETTGPLAFVAVNNDLQVVAVNLDTMRVVGSHAIDPFPVGLAVSRDDQYIVITSQGHEGVGGGNSINIMKVTRFSAQQTALP